MDETWPLKVCRSQEKVLILCISIDYIHDRTEVLNAAGALDDLPKISDEHLQIVESFKVRALNYANDFRNTVRRRLNPEKIKSLMETDRMATLGVATGAFVGFLL